MKFVQIFVENKEVLKWCLGKRTCFETIEELFLPVWTSLHRLF